MNELTLLRCICDETRLRILELINDKELCVNDLVAKLKKDQPLISHHLRTLKSCGIVKARQEGKKTMYTVSTKEISHLISNIEQASKKIVCMCNDYCC
jgi:DNA-binding transcriptional ArsR family regulator